MPAPATVTIPDGFKLCPVCKRVLPLDKFAKHSSTRDKKQSKCKDCSNHYRRHLTFSREEVAAEALPKPVVENVALPRTFVRREEYTPDKTLVYRNAGNKHILSKGDRT